MDKHAIIRLKAGNIYIPYIPDGQIVYASEASW